jgi:hypothetical protein
VANPTQERAPNAARFFTATTEADALDRLRAERAQFVVSDWELPFRLLPDGTIMGRFQNLLDWAGAKHSDYYEIVYRRDDRGWQPQWIFHEPYYRSMAYRLAVLGGAAAQGANATSLLTLADRIDANGLRFREVLTQRTYATYDAARLAAAAAGSSAVVVGLDPWQPAFPLERMTTMVEVYGARTAEQQPTEAPWVRVFAVR